MYPQALNAMTRERIRDLCDRPGRPGPRPRRRTITGG
jgi:hypothetical protein